MKQYILDKHEIDILENMDDDCNHYRMIFIELENNIIVTSIVYDNINLTLN